MNNRPQRLNNGLNELNSCHSINPPDELSNMISSNISLQRTNVHAGTRNSQSDGFHNTSGLTQDDISLLSRTPGLSSQDVLYRSPREDLINQLSMSLSSSLPSGSINSCSVGAGLNSGLLSPNWNFRNSFGGLDNSVGLGQSNGTDPSDTVREHIQRHLQQQQQQKQSLLMHENPNTFGANPSRIFSDQQSQGFLPSSLYSNMNKFSSLGQLDSSLLRQKTDTSSLLNRSDLGGSTILSNQLLQNMNYQLQYQQQELALRESQLKRGYDEIAKVLALVSYPEEVSSMVSKPDSKPADQIVSDNTGDVKSEQKNTASSNAQTKLVFANSSIAGIEPSRSTSLDTTPAGNGRVFYFPCRARGMEHGHNFESAYFTIHDGLDHGADLYCSHPACRAEGCKFRYCATCKAPAARRNFRKRHGHGEKPKRSSSSTPKRITDRSSNRSSIDRPSPCSSMAGYPSNLDRSSSFEDGFREDISRSCIIKPSSIEPSKDSTAVKREFNSANSSVKPPKKSCIRINSENAMPSMPFKRITKIVSDIDVPASNLTKLDAGSCPETNLVDYETKVKSALSGINMQTVFQSDKILSNIQSVDPTTRSSASKCASMKVGGSSGKGAKIQFSAETTLQRKFLSQSNIVHKDIKLSQELSDHSDSNENSENLNDCWDYLFSCRPNVSNRPAMDEWMGKLAALGERTKKRNINA